MSTSRRDFLKSSIIAGAGVAISGPAAAASSAGNLAPWESATPAADSSTGMAGYTRGIGIYPGATNENFSPDLVIDSTTYRNLALLRPAFHSSSYDYNLTAQLITDGIKDTHLPAWVSTSAGGRVFPKTERELLLDHFHDTVIDLRGNHATAQILLGGGAEVPTVDRIRVFVVMPAHTAPETLTFTISTSDDGRVWKEIGSATGGKPVDPDPYPPDLTRGAQLLYPSISFSQPSQSRYYQVTCAMADAPEGPSGTMWRLGEVEFYQGDKRVQIGGPYNFTSAWMAAGLDEEWVYVDLGAKCDFDRISLHWIARAAEGSIQTSNDATNWRDLQPLPTGTGQVDDIKLTQSAQARYVRVLMTRPATPEGYILSEIEVHGRGGPIARPRPAAVPADGRLNLAGGGWRLQRSNLVEGAGEALSKPGYKSDDWVIATVPGTVLTSYFNVGAVPDPKLQPQSALHLGFLLLLRISWYRTEFTAPPVAPGEVAWLNFEGINWKADIFLNGEKLGRIEGGFMRGRFDVTGKLLPGKVNALAVSVEKNATPGSCKQKTLENVGKNGGALGADDPTYHGSIGWDWIPTIRGRNTGIWGEVYVTVTGAVTLENPFVTTSLPLPDTSRADVTVEVDLVNHSAKAITGTLRGRFGDVPFEQRVTIEASATKTVKLDPSTNPTLRLQKPELWWPVGYGDPHLYDVELSFESSGHKVLDKKAFKCGVRQFTYNEDGEALRIFINGRRFVPRGGNWGFSESMLRYRAREYDASVRYHREMNFTMIRNWVGQIGEVAFYDACDKYGVVVWQDFWLANPWDGPIPNDNYLFMSNVKDLILKIRNHASIGLYCGRNEWFPPPPLDAGIRKDLAELHPGIHYIGSSADKVVSGHGPYQALPPDVYLRITDPKFHSEMGMPNIPTLESVKAMMPESAMWPQSLDWGIHDFCLDGAQGGTSFRSIIDESYGGADSAEEWISLAQFVNYEGYRAMFEAQSKYRMGLLLWMSHPCWPSFVWQTYDYYLEPTSAYFACKKASEPLHIQWNRLTDTIEVMNFSGGNATGLSAKLEILNMDGATMSTKSVSIDSAEDSTVECFKMEYPTGLTPVHFLRLTLTRGSSVLSTNIYMRGVSEGNYRAIRALPKAHVQAATSAQQKGNIWLLTTELGNTSAFPTLMTRLIAVREKSGDRILPAIYSDNYLTLMPGERLTIQTELRDADTRGEKPKIIIGGFNAESTS